jgi:single-stranded DNA-binding protein
LNAVHLIGRVSTYGVKLAYTEAAKPQASFTLVIAEGDFRLFVPVLIVGQHAEPCAETLEPGALIAVNGKLQYKKTPDGSKLIVAAYGVERLSDSPQDERLDAGATPESSELVNVAPDGEEAASPPKKGRPRSSEVATGTESPELRRHALD